MDFTLNGRPVSADVRDGETLLDMLRERFGVTSVKDGCAPEGACGACTVLMDGRARVSCAQAAPHAEGHEIVTQEGLDDVERRRWADAFVVTGASQCGFCSPGIVMKAEGLLSKQAAPTRAEIAHGLAGNLCRCTGYVKVIDAIDRVARERRGEPVPPPPSGDGVGARAPRYQGSELALGDKPYVADMLAPDMMHGAIRFSDHP
ncbi:MAG: 2Fe-2S iron-sulfur cluster-binding protein, partial [Actinomycetota bacterium]